MPFLKRPLTATQLQTIRDTIRDAEANRAFPVAYGALVTQGYLKPCPSTRFTNSSLLAIHRAMVGEVGPASGYLEMARTFGGAVGKEGETICRWAIREIKELTGLDIQPSSEWVYSEPATEGSLKKAALILGDTYNLDQVEVILSHH